MNFSTSDSSFPSPEPGDRSLSQEEKKEDGAPRQPEKAFSSENPSDEEISSEDSLAHREEDDLSDEDALEDKTLISKSPPLEVIVSSTDERPDGHQGHPPLEMGILPLGTKLGHFEVTKYIGGGGMGRVYQGVDQALDRKVAIKVLPQQRARDEATVARFMNEARSAARLNHEHIAQVYFAGEHEGLPFIAFEYVEGTNVKYLIEQHGVLPLQQAINYTLQISYALAHANGHGVVHRDVKPSNVLITPEGRAKLIDMGLARLLKTAEPGDDLTASGVTLGTFDYISPEQARDPRNADVRSDIYSLGCTLFFILAGRPPFPEGTVLQKLLQHQGDDPPDVRDFRPDVPEDASRTLQKMMAKDPRHRYQDPEKLIAALSRVARMIGLRPLGPGQTVWVTGTRTSHPLLTRHLPWLIPTSVFLVIASVLSIFWSSPPPPTAPPFPSLAGPSDSREGTSTDRDGNPRNRGFPDTEGTGTESEILRDPLSPAGSLPFPLAMIDHNRLSERFDDWKRSTSTVTSEKSGNLSLTNITGGLGSRDDIASHLVPGKAKTTVHVLSASKAAERSPTDPISSSDSSQDLPRAAKEVIYVDPDAADDLNDVFPSLTAAIAQWEKGQRIELRFDGPLEVTPFRIVDQKIEISASENFQPVLKFMPREDTSGKNLRDMVTLISGLLEIDGVDFELEIPFDIPAERWTLFDLVSTAEVRISHCTLTILNTMEDDHTAYHQDVAFFRRTSSELNIEETTPQRDLAVIELDHCMLRGEAVGLQSQQACPTKLTTRQCIAATSEPFLVTGIADSELPAEEGIFAILQESTFYTQSSFCRQQRGLPPSYFVPVLIESDQCVFLLSEAYLVETIGATSTSEMQGRFLWNGSQNVVQGAEGAWHLQPLQDDLAGPTMNFQEWMDYWKVEPLVEERIWAGLAAPSRPVHTLVPADFLLPLPSPTTESTPGERPLTIGPEIENLPQRSPTPE